MKGLYKWVGVFVAILIYTLMFQGTEAEAADIADMQKAYDHIITANNLTDYQYYFCRNSTYLISKQPLSLVEYTSFDYVFEGEYLYFTYNYVSREYTQHNLRLGINEEQFSTSYANFDFYSNDVFLYSPLSLFPSISINVNGTNYTVSESYPYYLALKDLRGNIRLFFSDSPFTASWADLYTMHFEISSDANIVWYYWDSGEENDFLESRAVSTGFESFRFKPGDHMSNYSIPDTNNPLYFILYEKEAFTLPTETLTAKDLYGALPDELSKYYHIIIFRQDSPTAYDNRILFYGWNDNNANLYIHSTNSQIAALNKKGVVSDYATAFYDESSGAWVISDDVILGATTDASYNVPYIFHSDLDLFVCDEWNLWNGKIAYPADDNRPLVSFEEPEPDEDESLLESILSGIRKLFVSLFVPSDGFFTARVNEISSNFGFWTSIRDTAAVFIDFLKETDFTVPPKIEIDLSLIKSKVNYGGKVYILDFSFYEPYKESVDVILSAIIWLVFAWNTYKNLPNIISGIGGGIQATAALSNDDGKE